MDLHRADQVLHRGADVLGDHHLHRVLGQEPGDPGVVGALSTLVVAGQPVDVDLLPVGDQGAVDGGQHCLLGTLRPVAAAVGRRRSGPSTPTTGRTWSTEWGGPGSRGCVTTAGRPALNDERHSSMGSYPHLLSPGHYGSLELPNRIVMPAMRTRLAHQDGTPGSRDAAFFVARIRGGVGLVTLGSLLVGTEFEPAQPCTARIDTDAFVPSMQYLTNAVHDAGGRIAAQLTVGAGRAGAPEPGRPAPVSASDNSWVANPVVTCRALTTEDIGLLVRRFRDAAARAAEGGFDAIDIAARVGHLVDQFLSPVWNRRTDAYGGSLENRTRLAVDLVAAVKAGAPGLPVSVRLSVAHHVPGGRDVADSIEIARVLQAAGVDLIITDDGAAEAMHWAVPPMYLGAAPSLAAATALRRALTVPVMATGSITPEVAITGTVSARRSAVAAASDGAAPRYIGGTAQCMASAAPSSVMIRSTPAACSTRAISMESATSRPPGTWCATLSRTLTGRPGAPARAAATRSAASRVRFSSEPP